MKKAVEGVVMCNYHPHGNSRCDESTLDAMKIAHRLGGELAETAASTLSEMGCDSPEFKWLVDEGCDLSQMPVEKAGELCGRVRFKQSGPRRFTRRFTRRLMTCKCGVRTRCTPRCRGTRLLWWPQSNALLLMSSLWLSGW